MTEDQCQRIYRNAIRMMANDKSMVLHQKYILQSINDEQLTLENVKKGVDLLLHNHPENLSGDTVDALLCLLDQLHPPGTHTPSLISILLSPNHRKHEDIVSMLQRSKDHRAVEALYQTAHASYGYLAYDEFFGLARKCSWALADIGTADAFAKLLLLAKSENSTI